MYQVRRVNIGKTQQLDELARECGRLYSQVVTSFWRTVRMVLDWRWELPKTVVIHWTGTQYEAIATYGMEEPLASPQGNRVAGIDLGEIHMAVSHDGTHTHILNGRLLRSKRQYRNQLQAKLNSWIDGRTKKGSRRRKKLIASKKRQLKKIEHQIKDIEHKQTTHLVSTLHQAGVQTVVIGDVRAIRQDMDVGSKNNQKLHQWSHGSVRHKLSYKAERLGMQVQLQDESYTSKTCPHCLHRRKSAVQGRTVRCSKCAFTWHRDGVGACTIRRKYLDLGPVVGAMAAPIGIRYRPHLGVARWEKEYQRENVCAGNCTEAPGL
jgi:putative transposase